MTQHNVLSSHPAPPWHAEAQRLLAKPFIVGQGAYREGQSISVQMTPRRRQADTTVELSVSISPRLLPPSTPATMTADKGARAAFLKGLQHTDYHIRIAACEALGQLGHPEARAALQSATHDEHHAVRAAATWALTALDTPRLQEAGLMGLRLVLWQQVQHLRTPLNSQVTDRRGRVQFHQVPADAVCLVHLLSKPQETGVAAASLQPVLHLPADEFPSQEPQALAAKSAQDTRSSLPQKETGVAASSLQAVLHLPADEFPSQEPQALAAKSAQDTRSSLPQTYESPLEEGSLLCTLYRDERGRIVIGVRSDAPQLQDGWVYVTAVSQRTQMETWHAFVALQPDRDGILTGTYVLSTALDPVQGYEIHCEPIPALRGQTE